MNIEYLLFNGKYLYYLLTFFSISFILEFVLLRKEIRKKNTNKKNKVNPDNNKNEYSNIKLSDDLDIITLIILIFFLTMLNILKIKIANIIIIIMSGILILASFFDMINIFISKNKQNYLSKKGNFALFPLITLSVLLYLKIFNILSQYQFNNYIYVIFLFFKILFVIFFVIVNINLVIFNIKELIHNQNVTHSLCIKIKNILLKLNQKYTSEFSFSIIEETYNLINDNFSNNIKIKKSILIKKIMLSILLAIIYIPLNFIKWVIINLKWLLITILESLSIISKNDISSKAYFMEFTYRWFKWSIIFTFIICYFYLLKCDTNLIILNTYQMIAGVLIIPIILSGLINIDKNIKQTIDNEKKI